MSRLILVSNRVALPNNKERSGGLAVTLEMALREHSGCWFGWSGKTNDSPNIEIARKGNIEYHLIDLTTQQIQHYYQGFANSLLWPLFHYRLDLIRYCEVDFQQYIAVNRLFAEQIAQYAQPDDIIWVHDYHLITLGSELRQLGVTNPIGFFLHIPFPCPDILHAGAHYLTLLEALACYDLLGFQSENDLNNFIKAIEQENLASKLTNYLYKFGYHELCLGVFPASIDSQQIAQLSREKPEATWQNMLDQLAHQQIILGVDRLDYSKGLTQRLSAFQLFLTLNPNYINRIKYLQITPKTRSDISDYRHIQKITAEKIGKINGNFTTLDWSPISYLNSNIEYKSLSAIYNKARIALVTPLRDGMNLVAKEYIAAQNPQDPGVLILSRFAGAAEKLKQALIVNPYDIYEVANAIRAALTMPEGERIRRWQAMKDYIDGYDTNKWCSEFLSLLHSRKSG